MDKVIIIRLGEIFLKGKNRGFFEKGLEKQIKSRLKNESLTLLKERNRYIVKSYKNEERVIALLSTIFGIASLSVALRVETSVKNIEKAVLTLAPKAGTFRITVNRGDKSFPITSTNLAKELGGVVLDNYKRVKVDLHNAKTEIFVDIREEGSTYLYTKKIEGAGGMPIGSAGEGLLLLSGGIDSPVAAYYMAKRGLKLQAIHFHSYPYTSLEAVEKVKRLKAKLEPYCGNISLYLCKTTKIQEAINKHCSSSYGVTLLRRAMMRLAKMLKEKNNLSCVVTGESLGQVASQTAESLLCQSDAANDILILRPLIGLDKNEIIKIAKKIDTYQTAIEPYEDCCTVFLPKNPIIKPTIEEARKQEQRVKSLDELIKEAFVEIEKI